MKYYLILSILIPLFSFAIDKEDIKNTFTAESIGKFYKEIRKEYRKIEELTDDPTSLFKPIDAVNDDVCIDCETALNLSEDVFQVIDMLKVTDTVSKNEKEKLASLILLTQKSYQDSVMRNTTCGISNTFKIYDSGHVNFLSNAKLEFSKSLPIDHISSFHFDHMGDKLLIYRLDTPDGNDFVLIDIDSKNKKTDISYYSYEEPGNQLPELGTEIKDQGYTLVNSRTRSGNSDKYTEAAARVTEEERYAYIKRYDKEAGLDAKAEVDKDLKIKGRVSQKVGSVTLDAQTKVTFSAIDASVGLQNSERKDYFRIKIDDEKDVTLNIPVEFEISELGLGISGNNTISNDYVKIDHTLAVDGKNVVSYSASRNYETSAETFTVKKTRSIWESATISFEIKDTKNSTDQNQLNQKEVWLTFKQKL